MAPERERAESYLKGEWTVGDDSEELVRRAVEIIVDAPTPAKKAGRKPLPREHFEEVAQIYRKACLRGANPTATVALEKGVSKSCAAGWVYDCRRPPHNLLPPTRQGVQASIAEIDKATSKRRRKS